MPLPERIIIDNSAFYALLSVRDPNHREAVLTYERLIDREQELWTTSCVLTEVLSSIHNNLGFERMHIFADSIRDIVHILWVESTLYQEAWEQMTHIQGTGLTLVDWITAVTAKRLRAYVFTFGKGFAKSGMAVLPRP